MLHNAIQKSFGFLPLATSNCLLNPIKVVLKHIVVQTSAHFKGESYKKKVFGIGGGNFQIQFDV